MGQTDRQAGKPIDERADKRSGTQTDKDKSLILDSLEKNSLFKRIQRLVFSYTRNEELPLKARMLNMVFVVGLVLSVLCMFLQIALGASPLLVALVIFVSALILSLMYFCNRYNLFAISTWITIITITDVVFPLVFFFLGGVNSAMAAYFVLSTVLIFFLLRGRNLLIMLAIHFVLVTTLYILAYIYPGIAPPLAPMELLLNQIFGFIFVGSSAGMMIKLMSNLYQREQELSNKANSLLSVINKIAGRLLSSDSATLDEDLHSAMGTLASVLDIDRMYVWKNSLVNGKLAYIQEYEWLADEDFDAMSVRNKTGFTYIDTMPDWERIFERGEVVNGPVAHLSEVERERLEPYGIRSIAVIPVTIQDRFWGFVSLDDLHREHSFTDEEIRLLRSGALIFASAVERALAGQLLAERLRQQELMSDISQSFISNRPMIELIHNSLHVIGEFLNAQRVLVITTDTDSGISTPTYAWLSDETWKLGEGRSALGEGQSVFGEGQSVFSEVISATFPSKAPDSGYVPPLYCDDVLTSEHGRYEVFNQIGLCAFIWAPLYVEGEFWGMISVDDCTQRREWSESDIQLVNTFSSAFAGAISRLIMDEERSEALEQAIKASQAKSDFLSNMSHEMRTPMNAIIGMTTIGKHAHDIRRKDEAFGKISDASSHLLGVINDILDMSKIEANKLELNFVNFNFEAMLQKVVNVIGYRFEENKQSFHVSIDPGIPQILVGDDQLLSQVITNLLVNANKFTPAGGTINLGAECLGFQGDTYTVKVKVSDTGIGINSEQKSRLFNLFEQAESGISRKYGGTGLGLAISKRIVELMGGDIEVVSEPGRGSTFSFAIQLKRGEDSGHEFESRIERSGVRILAVVCQPEDLAFFDNFSKRFDMNITMVASGEEALEHLKSNESFDIYFLDWRLPGMDGIKLAQRIRTTSDTNEIILMAAEMDLARIESSAIKAGVGRCLAKPLFPSAILEAISESLGIDRLITDAKVSSLSEPTDDFSGKQVLVVEDIEVNREIVSALLEPTKIKIAMAENGLIALQMFENDPHLYDIILMDVQMPQMDGLEATRRIRAFENPWARQVPIIAMTANVFRDDVAECLASGMNGHVGKPVNLDELLLSLRTNLKL